MARSLGQFLTLLHFNARPSWERDFGSARLEVCAPLLADELSIRHLPSIWIMHWPSATSTGVPQYVCVQKLLAPKAMQSRVRPPHTHNVVSWRLQVPSSQFPVGSCKLQLVGCQLPVASGNLLQAARCVWYAKSALVISHSLPCQARQSRSLTLPHATHTTHTHKHSTQHTAHSPTRCNLWQKVCALSRRWYSKNYYRKIFLQARLLLHCISCQCQRAAVCVCAYVLVGVRACVHACCNEVAIDSQHRQPP